MTFEQRRHLRLEQTASVRVGRLCGDDRPDVNATPLSLLHDLSESGLGAIIPCRLRLGEVMDIRLICGLSDQPEQGSKKTDVRLKARIVWIHPMDGGSLFRAGLAIEHMEDPDRSCLQDHLSVMNRR